MIKILNPVEAWQFIQQTPNAVLIDVRTKEEQSNVGYPLGSVHIAWQESFGAPINPSFILEIEKVVSNRDMPILLICRSGQRSMSAARALEQAGYRQLINISEGFEGVINAHQQRGRINGWQFHGLPWQKD